MPDPSVPDPQLVKVELMTCSRSEVVGWNESAAVFPDAVESSPGEYDIPGRPLEALNRQIGELIARGALVASVAPVHTALEQQFREAIAQ